MPLLFIFVSLFFFLLQLGIILLMLWALPYVLTGSHAYWDNEMLRFMEVSVAELISAVIVLAMIKVCLQDELVIGFTKKNLKKGLVYVSSVILAQFVQFAFIFLFKKEMINPAGWMRLIFIAYSLLLCTVDALLLFGVYAGIMMRNWKHQKNCLYKTVFTCGLLVIPLFESSYYNLSMNADAIAQLIYSTSVMVLFTCVYLRTRNIFCLIFAYAVCAIFSSFFSFNVEAGLLNSQVNTTIQMLLPNLPAAVGLGVFFTASGLYLIRPSVQKEILALWGANDDEKNSQHLLDRLSTQLS